MWEVVYKDSFLYSCIIKYAIASFGPIYYFKEDSTGGGFVMDHRILSTSAIESIQFNSKQGAYLLESDSRKIFVILESDISAFIRDCKLNGILD